ncbi:succinate-semialdehyde dehydrogenase [Fusarium albosuccineum]|uniref:Succinate-semialdehyde dehydrogenase n=1 Tax=Fusarium albosuccineum TaxID=1237068 RepID=A0A8H4LK41_9HYPO|nr:succinate-semialdehyde dehydrogenase [Fusarium albosuccineum]
MDSSMKLSCEETFGPVCGLFTFETEDEVTKLANDTSMGLASYVFSKNMDRLWKMFEKSEAGMIGLAKHWQQFCGRERVPDPEDGNLDDQLKKWEVGGYSREPGCIGYVLGLTLVKVGCG